MSRSKHAKLRTTFAPRIMCRCLKICEGNTEQPLRGCCLQQRTNDNLRDLFAFASQQSLPPTPKRIKEAITLHLYQNTARRISSRTLSFLATSMDPCFSPPFGMRKTAVTSVFSEGFLRRAFTGPCTRLRSTRSKMTSVTGLSSPQSNVVCRMLFPRKPELSIHHRFRVAISYASL